MVSDSRLLGFACCCIPRRWFIAIVAGFYFVHGLINVMCLFASMIIGQGSLTPTTACVGNKCLETLSCEGMVQATFHVKMVTTIFGGLFFGACGLLGAANSAEGNIQLFGSFFHILWVMYSCIAVSDGVYIGICDYYPYNVVDQALLWPYPNYPVPEAYKFEIRKNAVFHKAQTDKIIGFNLYFFYLAVVVVLICWFVFNWLNAKYVADKLTFGVHGMGPHQDLKSWRSAVIFREQVIEGMNDELARGEPGYSEYAAIENGDGRAGYGSTNPYK